MLETKFAALGVDDLDPDALRTDGRVSGYATLFDHVDDAGDRIATGAFADTLRRRAGGVKFLWQHDPATPIGVWDELREDARGLRVSGRLILESAAGREAATLLAAGALDGLSIGFRTVSAEAAPGGRRLIQLDLWEISLVTFPALPGARATPAAAPIPPEPPSEPSPDGDLAPLTDAVSALRSLLR